MWDEDVLSVDHVLTVMTVLGAAVAGARVFIPDENLVFSPEKSLTQVSLIPKSSLSKILRLTA